MTIQSEPTKHTDDKIAKKPYHKPELVVYGNIRELTRNVGTKGPKDGGTGTNDMSRL